MTSEEFGGGIYTGAPDDVARHLLGKHDDNDTLHLRALVGSTQATTAEALEWYRLEQTSPPFDPDGMCLKVCRTARNIGPMFASAKDAQDATPAKNRVSTIADIRRGMVAYYDTVGDSNPFGHIVTVAGRVKDVDRSKLESLVVWTNSVVKDQLVAVRGNYFGEHWGDKFQFGATWLNGSPLLLPEPEPPKVPVSSTLHVVHASLEIFDTAKQRRKDLHDLFEREAARKVAWITGTEGGSTKDSDQRAALEDVAEEFGFRMFHPVGADVWVAVRKNLIDGPVEVYLKKIVEGGDAHRDLFVFSVSFDNSVFGRLTVFAQHLLKRDRPNAAAKNKAVIKATGSRAAVLGTGTGKCFYGGDQNLNDKMVDTFFGTPFTSVEDELGKHESTGHGPIDCIATWDPDGGVEAKYVRVLDDTEFFQYGDHFVVEAGLDVRHLS